MVARLSSLKFIARKTLKKPIVKKILSLEDKEEQIRLFEYSIKAALELKYAEIKERVEEMDKNRGDSFIPLTKVYLLGSKVRYMSVTFHKRDFQTVAKLFNQIEKELKHVR